jgi:hypothetical protein
MASGEAPRQVAEARCEAHEIPQRKRTAAREPRVRETGKQLWRKDLRQAWKNGSRLASSAYARCFRGRLASF